METLHNKKIAKSVSASSTQQYLDVAEIRDNVIILKNGSMRAVLAVSAINFDLKSSQEQEAIINQYQNFLNSLDFPVQIIINSRKLNVDTYLEFIKGKEKEQPNELLRMQISEYRNFISELVSVSNIMDKNFYIVVPFSPIENKEKGFLGNLLNIINPQKNIIEKNEDFETCKNQLFQRVDHVSASLNGIGITMALLKTQELIELVFNAYNPSPFDNSKLTEVGNLELN